MRVCPNREQSCGKPKECKWKLLLRGAESTRRCISVAFSDADKRCLENCRNFSLWEEGEKGSKERRRESSFCIRGGSLAEDVVFTRGKTRELPDGTLTYTENIKGDAR